MAFVHPGRMHPNNIRVIAVRGRYEKRDGEIYVARPSLLGNPFVMKDQGDDVERKEVVEKYREWLRAEYRKGGPVFMELCRLAADYKEGKVFNLLCYCAPKACHADVIKDAIIGIANKGV